MLIKRTFFALLLSFLVPVLLCAPASADLFTPQIISIEDGQRADSITILNQADYAKVYEFEWEHRVQLPNGKRDVLKDGETVEGYRPAEPYITFSPRRVIIQPGDTQQVRFLVRRTADMVPGEYHSHFVIKPDRLGKGKAPEATGKELGGVLNITAHYSMPVFLRQGKTKLDFEYDSIKTYEEDGKDIIEVDITNNSTRSTYLQNRLVCTINGEAKDYNIVTNRLYVEARTINKKLKFRDGMPKLSECSSADLEVYATTDFEFKKDQVLKTYKIK